jgi:RNA polymerase sigma factor (sigma-70 family)
MNIPWVELPQEEKILLCIWVKGIAIGISNKIPPQMHLDDLIGEGVCAMIQAWTRFDPSRGVVFKTFAEYSVRGSMLRLIQFWNEDGKTRDNSHKPDMATYNDDLYSRELKAPTGHICEMLCILTPKQVEAVTMRYILGRPMAEVQLKIGIAIDSVTNRLRRANRRLRAKGYKLEDFMR